MMPVIYYSKVSTTSEEEYLLGYDTDDPCTGNVKVLRLKITDPLRDEV